MNVSQLFEDSFLQVLHEEGVKIEKDGRVTDSGYVDNPNDPGGETKFGISRRFLGSSPKDLTLLGAKEIYKRDFWLESRCHMVEEKSKVLAIILFDSAVNQGVQTATIMLQRVLGTHPDGIIGPITLRCIVPEKELLFASDFTLERIRRYNHLALVNHNLRGFLSGWIIRSFNILAFAKKYR